MNALRNARRQLKADPTSESSQTLASLVLALEAEGEESRFMLSTLYELDLKTFDLAIEILKDWRIERYANKKAKLFTMSQRIQSAQVSDELATVIAEDADATEPDRK